MKKGSSQKGVYNLVNGSPRSSGRRLSWCDFSPYQSPDGGGAPTLKLHSNPRGSKPSPKPSQCYNRSISPPTAQTRQKEPGSKNGQTMVPGFKKALHLLIQPNKAEAAELLAHFNSLRLYHRLLEPEIRPIGVMTTGRIHDKRARHLRRESCNDADDYTQVEMQRLTQENQALKSLVDTLTQELKNAKEQIECLEAKTATPLKSETPPEHLDEEYVPARRLSLPSSFNKERPPVPRLTLPTGNRKDFHEEFMENLPYFSQSWRDAIPGAK